MPKSPNLLSLGLQDKQCPAGTGQWVVKYVQRGMFWPERPDSRAAPRWGEQEAQSTAWNKDGPGGPPERELAAIGPRK